MRIRLTPLFLALALALLGGFSPGPGEGHGVHVHEGKPHGKLRDAFKKKQPGIAFDYYSAGAGKVMAKLAAERQAGKLAVDVLWHSEVPDFFS